MKICIISSTIFPCPPAGYSGLEMISWQRAKGLAEKGHKVWLVAPDGSSCPGVEIIPTGPAGQHDEHMAYGGYPEHKEGEIVRRRKHAGYWQILPEMDVVIDDSWAKWSYMLKAEGVLKAPVLGVTHAPVNTMWSKPPPVEKPCVVCISDDQKAHYEALFSPAQARRAWNGIDLDFYKPLDIPRSNRFLFLARFSTIKGPDLAIEACRKAGVGLDLVGDTSITNEPELLERCKGMVSEANYDGSSILGNEIRLVGSASRGECVWWFSQAHCMLHPNQRFREPFGLAPIEAMACGCPVIAWDYGAMRESVKTGPATESTGRLVKTIDEFNQSVQYAGFADPVYDGERVPDTWRRNCREWVSQFSVQNMVQCYHDLCEEAADTGGW